MGLESVKTEPQSVVVTTGDCVLRKGRPPRAAAGMCCPCDRPQTGVRNDWADSNEGAVCVWRPPGSPIMLDKHPPVTQSLHTRHIPSPLLGHVDDEAGLLSFSEINVVTARVSRCRACEYPFNHSFIP